MFAIEYVHITMKCIVTGAGGFIGSHLAEALIKEGYDVIALDRFSPGKRDNLADIRGNSHLTICKMNVCDDLSPVFEARDIDVVFHMAAMPKVQYSIQHPIETHEANLNGTLNVLEACRTWGVKRFVFSSSCAVYGDQNEVPFRESFHPKPISPYAVHKFVGEQYAALYYSLYGLETINLRYFNAFGPRQDHRGDYANLFGRFIMRIKAGESPIINGDGKNSRDYVHVSDIVQANIRAAQTTSGACFGQVINIGSGKALSVNDVYEHIMSLHPTKIAPVYNPPVVEIKHAVADIGKAQSLLGWSPQISFEEGLLGAYSYFINEA